MGLFGKVLSYINIDSTADLKYELQALNYVL